MSNFKSLKAVFVNCTLKKSPDLSHTRGLIDLSASVMSKEGAEVEIVRMADYPEIAYGVFPDMKDHGVEIDEWPEFSKKILEADILVIGTPIWLGEKSSLCQKFIERLYSLSGMTNDKGQYLFYGKVGGCIITGNEDGAKHCAMGILYALQHIGYSIPPQADCGWLGSIGPGPSYLDSGSGGPESDFTNRNTTFMTYNLLHLAKILNQNMGYPTYGNSKKDWEDGERWNFEAIHSSKKSD